MTRWDRVRRRQSRIMAAAALAAGSLLAGPAIAHAAPLTVVTIQFDDGNADTIQWIDGSLNTHGFQPESFAYPFGDYDATVETQVVQYCGDNSARTVTGVNDKTVFAETMPPLDPYATRTPADPKRGTPLATIEGYVTYAEQNGGGWVQLTFHHICDGCDAYSIPAAMMQSLLDWLSTQVSAGAVAVETTKQVIGGPYVTPFCC